MNARRFIVVSTVGIIAAFNAVSAQAATLKLSPLFADHMVVQRDRSIRVWGQAAPGASVEVKFSTAHGEVKANQDGAWEATLEKLPAGGPYDLQVKSASETTEIHDILVGDVWLCSGQSNMQMTLKESLGGPVAAQASGTLKNVRIATVGRKASDKPETTCEIRWRAPSPETSGDFSAVGYYFVAALRVDKSLENVPIGVIDSSFGGSMCEAWIPQDALTGFDPSVLRLSLFGTKPSGYYNAMIAPLTRNPIKGAVWYQGEGNTGQPRHYPSLLTALILSWRERFATPELPFIVIQLPDWVFSSDGYSWAWLRGAQASVAKQVPHTSLAVGIETTDGYNLHPKEKTELGRRAALCALRDV